MCPRTAYQVWPPCTGQDVQTQDDSLSTYITQAGKVRVWAEPSRFFAPHVCCPWSGCNKDRARWCERPNRGKLLPVPKLERVEESAWQCQEPPRFPPWAFSWTVPSTRRPAPNRTMYELRPNRAGHRTCSTRHPSPRPPWLLPPTAVMSCCCAGLQGEAGRRGGPPGAVGIPMA